MPLIELNTNPTDRQLRQFAGLVVPLAALFVLALLWWRGLGWTGLGAVVLGGVAIGTLAFAVVGAWRPAWARPVYVVWMIAAYPLGWIVGHVVLGAVYYLIVTPIGLIMRIIGRDPLTRRFDPNRTSYWEPRQENTDAKRYFRQF
jgi:hypothetical protein